MCLSIIVISSLHTINISLKRCCYHCRDLVGVLGNLLQKILLSPASLSRPSRERQCCRRRRRSPTTRSRSWTSGNRQWWAPRTCEFSVYVILGLVVIFLKETDSNCLEYWSSANQQYRVTRQLESYILLTSKQKFCHSRHGIHCWASRHSQCFEDKNLESSPSLLGQ